MKHLSVFLLQALLIPFFAVCGIKPVNLTCEYLTDPAVVDVLQPRLSWVNEADSGERGQFQTAYQIRVASSPGMLATPDLWDSHKIPSPETNRIVYNGKPLSSRQECWWQVRVWDRNGRPSEWSKPAFWRMGLLHPSDWQAMWIGAPWQGEEALPPTPWPSAPLKTLPPPAPLLRKAFYVQKEVVKAVAFVTGLGYFELYVNGSKVSDDELVPNQTNYGKRPGLPERSIPLEDSFREYRVMYLAYDITSFLRQGENVVGAMLGNGFYNPGKFWCEGYGTPRFIGQIYLTYSDGTEDVIVSDRSWKASRGPVVMDMVYFGEHYDVRLEQPGWNAPGFDDALWEFAAQRKAPEGKLVAHTALPDKVTKRIAPVSIRRKGPGTYRVSFGEEISGRLRIQNVSAPAGHKVTIRYLSNLFSGDNSYTFGGKGMETYASRFNWFVFHAVEISNWPGELRPDQLVAEAVNTAVEEAAVFETSSALFNSINRIWKRSQLDNMHGGIASDCPHRERSAYTGDGQIACVTVMHNFDARAFYYKWIRDIYGAQNPETGYVPNGAPWQPGCGGGVAWGAAICIIPWEFYVHYGARDILTDTYEAMKDYVRYMLNWVDTSGIMYHQRTGKDGKPLRWFNLGEWCAPGQTIPDDMAHTFYLWYCADITAKTAYVLGFEEERRKYEFLAERTRQAFQKKYFDPVKGTYGDGGGNILALKMGVPADQYPRIIEALKRNLKATRGHLDTGILGTRFFFEVLAENGLQDLAFEAMNKKTYPSYGYWLKKGATTTRERWDNGGSHNHPMFGGGLVWFYRNLAGMQADPNEPGYKHIVFRPQPVPELDRVAYFLQTPYGKAGLEWKQEKDRFTVDILVPPGSHATVYVPAKKGCTVLESGRKPSESPFLQEKGWTDSYAVFETASGKYQFTVQE